MKKVIDISAWQEDINWESLKNDIDGVILKLGEREHLDDMFVQHVNNAVAVGIPYGVYYYAHADNINDALDEADWVDKTIKTWLAGKTPELGIWYDAEDGSMTEGSSSVTECVSAFINHLNGVGYTYVGVYSSWNWLSSEGANYIKLDLLADYVPIWVANYGFDNTFNGYHRNYLKEEYPNKNIKIHQFTDSGNVSGINGNIDCNNYFD